MEKEFRLIEAMHNVDNITKDKIEIFELTPIEYNFNKTGYNFKPGTSVDNSFFVYLASENASSQFLNNPEEIKTMDLAEFELKINRTINGKEKVYYSKKLVIKRRNMM